MNNKFLFKKIMSLILSVLLVFSFVSVATADTVEKQIQLSLAPIYSEGFDIELANSLTPEQERLAEHINSQLKECRSFVDISDFLLYNTGANQQLIVNILSGELPEAFHLGVEFELSIFGYFIVGIIPKYEYRGAQYQEMLAECESKATALLNGIEGNSNLSTEEKLLLLHDRIALNCEYDPQLELTGNVSRLSHTMYGVLAKEVAVCQGYAIAYGYLLDRIGIKNSYCSSVALCHAWNIVYVNNTPYHVDITWDDPAWDVSGQVYHNNFLVSSSALWNTGHKANDYETTPTSTTYDNYFWQRSTTSFVLVDGEIYYIDNIDGAIKRKRDKQVIHKVNDVWQSNSVITQGLNFAKLDTDGTDLLYSLSNGVYRYQPSTGATTTLYSPNLIQNHSIFGFTLDMGELIIEACPSPIYDENTKNNYTRKIQYSPADAAEVNYKRGDIDNDNKLDLLDVVTLSRYVSGWKVSCNSAALDVNADKKVDLMDVARLAKFVSGWEGVVIY